MLLTSLHTRALNLSQWATDSIFLIRPLIIWDQNAFKFVPESRKRHIWPWLFINYVVIAGIASPGCCIFLYQSLTNSKVGSPLYTIITLVGLCFCVAAPITVLTYRRWGYDLILFLNKIIDYEFILWRMYSTEPSQLIIWIKNRQRRKFSALQLPNGEIDILGILAYLLTPALSFIPAVLPWGILWLEVDIPYIMLQRALVPYLNYYFVLSCRVIICVWSVAEICTCFRTLALIAIMGFRGMHSCHLLLISQPISEFVIMKLRQLEVLFAVIRDWCSFTFSAYLGMIFILLITVVTGAFTTFSVLAWYVYIVGDLIAIITAALVSIILFLVVSIDLASGQLHQIWKRSLTQVTMQPLTRRLLLRKLKSIQPIRIPYGTLGAFKKATRTDFFSSLTIHTLNSILTFGSNMYCSGHYCRVV